MSPRPSGTALYVAVVGETRPLGRRLISSAVGASEAGYSTSAAPPRWVSLATAADLLGLTAAALRKTLDRRTVRVADGGIEAELDGVRARKFGRLWRVSLSGAWTTPVPSPRRPDVGSSSRVPLPIDRDGERS